MGRTVALKPDVGRLIPGFCLNSIGGGRVSPWDFKGRKNLVIAFFGLQTGSSTELLTELKHSYPLLREEETEVLAIGRGSEDELARRMLGLGLPYAVLADPKGLTHDLYVTTGPAVFVADRFGELLMRLDPSGSLGSQLDTVLSRLALIEMQCPECGVPTWDQ